MKNKAQRRSYLKLSDGVELFYEYYENSKNKKTLVFINGLFQCVFNWYPLRDKLLDQFNLLIYDLRGQGKSKVQDQEITLDRHVNDLYELLLSLKLEKVNIVGMSLGAIIGLLFANNFSEKVEKMVLLGVGDGIRLEMIIDDWKNILQLLGDFAFFKFLLPWIFSNNFLKKNEEKIQTILDALIERNPLKSLIKHLSSITPYPEIKELIQEIKKLSL